MKKIFMTMAAMCVAVCASAQVYVGGGVGIGSHKDGKADATMTYKFVPEIGYSFNKSWDAGISFGWEGEEDHGNKFEIAPYVRYNVMPDKLVNIFLEGTVAYTHDGEDHKDLDGYKIGIVPGVSLNLSKHVAFVTKVGFLGYKQEDKGAYKCKKFGLDLDGRNVTFGVNYKF